MSKNRHHYNNYDNNHERREFMTPPVVEEEEVVEEVEETTEVDEPVEEVEETVEQDEAPAVPIGIVADCIKLRVRKEPNASAEVVEVLECGSRVEIDVDATTMDFYKVVTASGVEGYCMKKFIAVV